MGLKLARVLEGVKESEYAYSPNFMSAVKAMAKKLAGNWTPDFDRMTGSLSWEKGGTSKWSFYATPNWDGADNTPVNVQFDSDDVEGHGGHKIAFSLDVKKSPEENAANYIAHVVVPTINDIERGKYGKKESKLRLGAVLGEAVLPESIGSLVSFTDKGKELEGKIVGENDFYYKVKGADGDVYQVDKSKAEFIDSWAKYAAESTGPVGLRRAVLGEVKDLSWLGKDNRLKPLTKREGEGKGKSAVRGLRAAIKSAEEDMTPGIGKQLARPDLGSYGRRKGEAVKNIAADFSDLAFKGRPSTSDVENLKSKLWMKTALISNLSASYGHSRKEAEDYVNAWFAGKSESAARHSALEDAIKQASDMLKPRRDSKGRLILVGEEAGIDNFGGMSGLLEAFKYTGDVDKDFTDDHPLLIDVIIDTAVDRRLGPGSVHKQDMVRDMTKKFGDVYKANRGWAEKILNGRGNSGRDTLYAFINHWVDAALAKK